MAVQDHLKIASAELMKAANLVRQEITELRSEEGNLQKLVDQNVAQLTIQIQNREQEVRNSNDPSAKSNSQTYIDHLVREIAESRNQLQRDRQRIQDAIKQKESLISSLDQQAASVSS